MHVLERCATGRLRDTYPVHAHDVEVRLDARAAGDELAAAVGAAARHAFAEDPRCRRVVFAADVDDTGTIESLGTAGFRHVVDVDIPGESLALLVLEPDWIRELDTDRVPGT